MKRITTILTILLITVMLFGSASAYEALQKGSKGDDVKRLQQALIEQGYLDGKADGDFGKKTAGAVSAFQKANQVEETGIADELTQQILYGEIVEPDAEPDFNGTWYFTSYEYMKYVSTPDRQKLHVQMDIDDDGITLNIDQNGNTQTVETTYFFNDGGIAFSIENDASYLLKEDENGKLYIMGAGDGKIFPGYKYIFDHEAAAADPAIGSNPEYWWEGDWVIYNVYDRDKMENTKVEGSISFGAYLDTDVNYAEICFPDGTVTEYTYDFLPDLMLLNDEGHISVTRESEDYCSFSYGGSDYSFARTAPAEPEKEEQFYDLNVFLHNADTGEFITYGDPVSVSLNNRPDELPEDMIPQTLEYNQISYYFDVATCTAAYNPERHGYEVYMKSQAEEEEAEEAVVPLGTGYVPVNPWIYDGSNFENILGMLIAERGWGPEYTFNADDSSFVVNDNFGSEMQGHFNDEGDGAYSMTVLVDGMERTIYAEDFSDYASDWDDLVLDPDHEYLDSLIQDMIRKEEKSSWWIELNDDGMSGIAEDSDDNEVPFTYEFALSDAGEEYVKVNYNGKTIDNISIRG